ncbi:MAG: hypothetical protein KAJ03_13000 [Gammaproteobacteria bacterium]|nr:hypothetical protein [Gammaproteobacteria bacterium]
MALPTTITSNGGIAGHQPPFKSSAGNFYAVAPLSTGVIDVYKATDPVDGSWTVQSGGPATTMTVASCVQAGDNIHVAHYSTGTGLYYYSRFNMSTDTWDRTQTSLGTLSGNLPTFPWCSIAVRNDGDIICVIAAETDQVMGGKKERVDYIESTDDGANWGTHTALDAAGDIHYGNPSVAKGPLTDDMHIVFQYTGNIADPPTAWTGTKLRTLDSANSLSTVVDVSSDSDGTMLGLPNIVTYEDAGTQRIFYTLNSPASILAFRTTEDGSDNIQDGTPEIVTTDDPFINGEVGVVSVAEDSGILYILYSAALDSQDIWYLTSTDDGDTWPTEVEEVNTVVCNRISCNVLQIGANKVLAFIYDDNGVIKFNAKTLTALSYTQLDHAEFNGLVNSHVGPFEIA